MSVAETALRPIAPRAERVCEPLRILFLQTHPSDDIASMLAPDGSQVGTYAEWVADAYGLSSARDRFHVVKLADVSHPDPLPTSLDPYDGIIAGGSGHNTTEGAPWMIQMKGLLGEAVGRGMPVNAICFSHQSLHEEGGGQTGETSGYVFGIQTITPTEAGKEDPLLRGLPNEIVVFKSHGRVVTERPESMFSLPVVELASGDYHNEIVAIGDNVRTTQAHPELRVPVVLSLAAKRRPTLVQQGVLDGSDDAFAALQLTIMEEGVLAESHGRLMNRNFIEHMVAPYHLARQRSTRG